MSQALSTTRVLIAGTYVNSDAYPNIKYRIEQLHRDKHLQVTEIHGPVTAKINYASTMVKFSSIAMLLMQLSIKSLGVLFAIIKNRSIHTLYIPYPAIHILWALSFIPARFIPSRIVADVFISIYDTVVVDRKLLKKNSLMAKALLQFEKRAFYAATVLITDTPENSSYYASLLSIDKCKFKALPLSINERNFKPHDVPLETAGPLSVLFIGTLVPLHNISLLCEAISQLGEGSEIEFTIIGDGQDAPVVEQFLSTHSATSTVKCHWQRAWVETPELARTIQNADLCIGILGHTGKSQRVWPFKNYLYLACGKALVTTRSDVSQRLQAVSENPAFFEVDTSSSTALTTLLGQLIINRQLLVPVSQQATRFYQEKLSSHIIADELRNIIIDV